MPARMLYTNIIIPYIRPYKKPIIPSRNDHTIRISSSSLEAFVTKGISAVFISYDIGIIAEKVEAESEEYADDWGGD
jgi:hypothetical protein